MKEIRLIVTGPNDDDIQEFIISMTRDGPEIRRSPGPGVDADRSVAATFGPDGLPVTLVLKVE
jgi:hypothetical protein